MNTFHLVYAFLDIAGAIFTVHVHFQHYNYNRTLLLRLHGITSSSSCL